MLTYEKLKKKPSRFLALTSLSVEKSEELLPAFKKAWAADVEKRAYAQPRKRKAVDANQP